MKSARGREREMMLDDVPESIRGTLPRRLEDRSHTEAENALTPEEKETMCVWGAFLAERTDTYAKHHKHTELNPQKMKFQLPQFSDKEIETAMQEAVGKEIGTWQRFDASDIIPPKESQEIRESNPEKEIHLEEYGPRRTTKREMKMKRRSWCSSAGWLDEVSKKSMMSH